MAWICDDRCLRPRNPDSSEGDEAPRREKSAGLLCLREENGVQPGLFADV